MKRENFLPAVPQSSRFVRIWFITILFAMLFSTSLAQLVYNPADSILYYNFQGSYTPEGQGILLRFHDGGARVTRPAGTIIGGVISTTDGYPGHLFINHHWIDSSMYDRSMQYRSLDSGETWTPFPEMPTWYPTSAGSGGLIPGQSTMARYFESINWVYTTSNSWLTYDSTRVIRQRVGTNDSVGFLSLTHQLGTLLGLVRASSSTSYLCHSSDTGRTWEIGIHQRPINEYLRYCGVFSVNELWVYNNFTDAIQLLSDSGRTLTDSIFVPHPPPRLYSWSRGGFSITNRPGEFYWIKHIDYWTYPPEDEIIVYHVQNYGATVDSTYYYFVGYQPVSVPERQPPIPIKYSMSVYPNPFNSSLTISIPFILHPPSTVKITDMTGRTVWSSILSDGKLQWRGVDRFGLPVTSGKYWITIHSNKVIIPPKSVVLVK